MKERFIRLNEEELQLLMLSLFNFQEDTKKDLDFFKGYGDEEKTNMEITCEELLERTNSLLDRVILTIEDID